MSPWILNYLASPNVLLDSNNNPSSDSKLTPIVNMSSKQRVLCETLTERAQEFCKEKFATMGPASPIHSPNPFIRWFASCTTNSNTKSIFYQFLHVKYGHIPHSAIAKLEKIRLPGQINERRIGRALARGNHTFNTAKIVLDAICSRHKSHHRATSQTMLLLPTGREQRSRIGV